MGFSFAGGMIRRLRIWAGNPPLFPPCRRRACAEDAGVGDDDESRPRMQDLLLKGTSVNALLHWIADNPSATFFVIAVALSLVASRFPHDDHWMDGMR
jgi:hypothetical protein